MQVNGLRWKTERLNSSCSKKDHEGSIIESHRIRKTRSTEKTHKDHITDRVQVSMSHYNVVHKPISIPKAVTNPAARVWNGQRLEQVESEAITCVWACWLKATVPLVGRTQNNPSTKNVTHHTRFKSKSHIKHITLTFVFFLTLKNLEHQCKSESYTSALDRVGSRKHSNIERCLKHLELLNRPLDQKLINFDEERKDNSYEKYDV